jgi:hypothetical protein
VRRRASAIEIVHLPLLRQILTTRSIVEVAIRPLKCLTEQAEFALSEADKARCLAAIPTGYVCRRPRRKSLVAVGPKWLIVIWYGEDLTQ